VIIAFVLIFIPIDILETTFQQADMFSGQTSHIVKFNLLPSAFLNVGDSFRVALTGYKLKTGYKLTRAH
jgi:hypothetical protein